MAELTHWRRCVDNEHLRAELLPQNEDVILTIKCVKQEEVKDGTGRKSIRPVAHFEEEGVLPMVLNVTNCKTIDKIYNDGYIEDWAGKKIQVFATNVPDKKNGGTVTALRIRPFIPKDKIEYKCCECGKIIDANTYKASMAKYGAAFCSKECLESHSKGKDVL